MKSYRLDARLCSAISFARQGKIAADVGTDHAMLPITLVERGIAPRAVASDINKGPLERARLNISSAGLTEKIATVLTDGLNGLEGYGAQDIYILGMGGELISRIVLWSEIPRSPGIRLIMQPMTHAHDLRRELLEAGFEIIDELLSADSGRIYQTVCAEYDGKTRTWTPLELVLGRHNIARGGELLKQYAAYLATVYETRVEGMVRSGRNADSERQLLSELKTISESGTENSNDDT